MTVIFEDLLEVGGNPESFVDRSQCSTRQMTA